MVAAAGFMLKHENMKAMLKMTVAFTTRNTCEEIKRRRPSVVPKMFNTSPGGKTNMAVHGNQKGAKNKAIAPRESTSTAAKMIPESHLRNIRRNREMGRQR